MTFLAQALTATCRMNAQRQRLSESMVWSETYEGLERASTGGGVRGVTAGGERERSVVEEKSDPALLGAVDGRAGDSLGDLQGPENM